MKEVLRNVSRQDERMAEGGDMPGTSHGGRLSPPWKGQEEKMV